MVNRNILVVGGAGFIGSYLCKELIEKGYFVVAYDNLMRGKKENIAALLNNPNFLFVKADANDLNTLKKIITENKIEYIFHCRRLEQNSIKVIPPGAFSPYKKLRRM